MTTIDLLKDMYKTFILHAVAAHFIVGLIPVSALFLVLALLLHDPFFEHTVFHMIVVAVCILPINLLSGIRDWQVRFKGGRAPIFYTKIKLTVLLLFQCAFAVSSRLWRPDILAGRDAVTWLYVVSIITMLPVIVLLGHYGAKLASQRVLISNAANKGARP